MKLLLVHPADDPESGPWAAERWGQVVDLGLAGIGSYQRWTTKFGRPAVPLSNWRNGFEELHRVRELLALGRGRLKDAEDLDWWELTAIFFHQEMESLVLLERFAESLGHTDELYLTRPGFHADALRGWLGNRLHVFDPASRRSELSRHFSLLSKFTPSQLVQIFWDKYDSGYQVRGRFTKARSGSQAPVVLLPSAYVNVSRTAIAYANTAPDTDFLLVATRRSGLEEALPPNVRGAALGSYASLDSNSREHEHGDLLIAWQRLKAELNEVPEIGALASLGVLENFPKRFYQGLQIRDAWRQVFARETIQSVLCGDDSNPYTRIPLLLAKKRGIPAIACHHGALDGRYLIKRSHADVILAKGNMERDYLTSVCGVDADNVETGAPARSSRPGRLKGGDQSLIVLFSEVYEVSGGRALEFYRDILPPLGDLAIRTGKKLVVKLHPAESHHERSLMVEAVLSPEALRATTISSGGLTDELLANTWFGLTILSTVATECALKGIPCFLCEWLEGWPYGYVEQFARFGVGQRLRSPQEISQIPAMLQQYRVNPNVGRDLWQPIRPERLKELLSCRKTQERKVDFVA